MLRLFPLIINIVTKWKVKSINCSSCFKSSRSKNVCSKWLNFSELGISFLQNTSIYPAIFDPWSEYVFVLNAFFSLAKEVVGQYPISLTDIQDQVHISLLSLIVKKSTEKIIYLWKWAWKAGQCILKDVKDEQLLVLIDYTGLHLFNACRKLWNTNYKYQLAANRGQKFVKIQRFSYYPLFFWREIFSFSIWVLKWLNFLAKTSFGGYGNFDPLVW